MNLKVLSVYLFKVFGNVKSSRPKKKTNTCPIVHREIFRLVFFSELLRICLCVQSGRGLSKQGHSSGKEMATRTFPHGFSSNRITLKVSI